MKQLILFLLFLLHVFYISAQNLVPNPSFESTANIYCGIIPSSAQFTACFNDWLSPTGGTPDIYSTTISQSCYNFVPNSTYSGPIGFKGTQMPRTGNNFIGIGAYTISGFNQREYIQVPLAYPMTKDSTYVVEFYVSLSDNIEKYTDRLGALLTTTPISGVSDLPLSYIPQVQSAGYISDIVNWVRIADTIIVISPYTYLTIGNFFNDASTSTQSNPSSLGCVGCYGAYYYIDDVSITKITVPPPPPPLPPPVPECIEVYIPNAFSPNKDGENDILFVQSSCISAFTLKIFDRWGEKVFETNNLSVGWDGKYKDAELNSAVFAFYCRVTFLSGKQTLLQGNISLVR